MLFKDASYKIAIYFLSRLTNFCLSLSSTMTLNVLVMVGDGLKLKLLLYGSGFIACLAVTFFNLAFFYFFFLGLLFSGGCGCAAVSKPTPI